MLRVLLMSATISLDEERELIRLFSDNLHHNPMVNGKSSAIRIEDYATRPELHFDISYSQSQRFDSDISKEEKKKLKKEESENRARGFIAKLTKISQSLGVEWNERKDGSKFRPDGRPSPILIYTPYPEVAEKFLKPIAIEKIGNGVKTNITTYTGNTPPLSRLNRLERFVQNNISGMIATSAFGMGVDKEDLWVVGYYGMPYSLSDLYQGFGRAARNLTGTQIFSKSGYCLGTIFGKVRPFLPTCKSL